MLDHDFWLLLAGARRHRADGNLEAALDAYQRVELGGGAADATEIARRERRALAAWLNLATPPAAAPLSVLRAATQRRPSEARARAAQLDPAHGPLLAGLAALLAGEVRESWGLLAAAAGSSALPGPAAAAARLGR